MTYNQCPLCNEYINRIWWKLHIDVHAGNLKQKGPRIGRPRKNKKTSQAKPLTYKEMFGEAPAPRKKMGRFPYQCSRGIHKNLTSEQIGKRTDGKIFCRLCAREKQREYRRKGLYRQYPKRERAA